MDVVSSLEADAAAIAEQLAEADAAAAEFTPRLACSMPPRPSSQTRVVPSSALGDEGEVRAARQAQAVAAAGLEQTLKALELDGEHLAKLNNNKEATQRRLATLGAERGLQGELDVILSGSSVSSRLQSKTEAALHQAELLLEAARNGRGNGGSDHHRADARAESLAGALRSYRAPRAQGVARSCRCLRCAGRPSRGRQWFRVCLPSRASGRFPCVCRRRRIACCRRRALLHSLRVSGTLLPATAPVGSPDTEAHYSNGSAPAYSNGATAAPHDAGSSLAVVLPTGAEPLRSHVRATVPEVEAILDALLASTAVVTSGWQQAAEMALDQPELTFLTTDGDRFSADGWTVGLAARGLTAAVVDEARAKAGEAARSVETAEAATECRNAVRARQSRARAFEEILVRGHDGRSAIERSIEQNRAVSDALEGEMKEADPERAARGAGQAGRREPPLLRAESAALSEVAEATANRVAQAERARLDHASRVTDLAARRNDVQVRAGSGRGKTTAAQLRLGDVEKRLSGHAEERQLAESRRRRIVSDTVAVERLQGVVEAHQARVESVASQLQELRDQQVEMLRAGGARLEDLRRRRIATDDKLGWPGTTTRNTTSSWPSSAPGTRPRPRPSTAS